MANLICTICGHVVVSIDDASSDLITEMLAHLSTHKTGMPSKCLICGGGMEFSTSGDWCSNCGFMNPCPCKINRHQDCVDSMNRIRKISGKTSVSVCCCRLKSK